MQQINIDELKPHPRNNEFFDDITGEKWEELLESIRKRTKENKRGNILQRPGGCPKEMQHGFITARGKSKVTYYGSNSKLIRAEHKPCCNGHEPAESSFTRKTGFKVA